MTEMIDMARAVFALFEKRFNEISSPTTNWTLGFENEDDGELALSKQQIGTALKVLLQKQLIRMQGIGRYRLDKAGVEACMHPEVLDEYLAPRREARPAQHVTINAENMQNTQVGHNNTQKIAYSTSAVLSALREQVEASSAPHETKQGWVATIDDMLRHPLMPGIVTIAAAAAGAAGR